MRSIHISGFLTQAKLETALRELLGPDFIGRERRVGTSLKRWDMEVLLQGQPCFVEFDGEGHYCVPSTILADEWKDAYAEETGAKVVRIPYFIQLTSETLLWWFNIAAEVRQEFPHGFIDNKAKLPAAFCSLGVSRFRADLRRVPESVALAVVKSLQGRCKVVDRRLVLPEGLLPDVHNTKK